MFGMIGVILSLIVYIVILKKNAKMEKKLWYLVILMVGATVGVSILMGFHISLGTSTKYLNETVGNWAKQVIAQ